MTQPPAYDSTEIQRKVSSKSLSMSKLKDPSAETLLYMKILDASLHKILSSTIYFPMYIQNIKIVGACRGKSMVYPNLSHKQTTFCLVSYWSSLRRKLNRRSNTFLPRNLPFKMVTSIMFFIQFLMTNIVPLQSHGGRSNLQLQRRWWHVLYIHWIQKLNWIINKFIDIRNNIDRFVRHEARWQQVLYL